MPRAFFLGAGASKADKFPLTRELLCAVSAYLKPSLKKVTRGKELGEFLQTAFGARLVDLRTAADLWQRHVVAVRDGGTKIDFPPEDLPNLTDVLSALDILLAEESGFGPAREAGRNRSSRALKGISLRKAREHVATALALGFNELHNNLPRTAARSLVIDRFVNAIGGDDVLITTNWDILLDEARDRRFGTTAIDYGSDVEVFDSGRGKADRQARRPWLLKLHGSLNWLSCPRCSRLRADVRTVTAHDGYNPGNRNLRSTCSCGFTCGALMITPTFLKSYQNRHLLNIWNAALNELARCPEWVFIGYSLPDDDIQIKTLLLKAKRMRVDTTGVPPEITVVTEKDNQDTKTRYRRIFGDCVEFHWLAQGFDKYTANLWRKRETRRVSSLTPAQEEGQSGATPILPAPTVMISWPPPGAVPVGIPRLALR
jgi:hypothetical protein